jgi:hypothetical protein
MPLVWADWSMACMLGWIPTKLANRDYNTLEYN